MQLVPRARYEVWGTGARDDLELLRFADEDWSLDLHGLAEERSLAYHRVVAGRLLREPHLLEGVRTRLLAWIKDDRSRHHATAWLALVEGPIEDLRAFLVDRGQRARELRQSTPFAGLVDARERWRIWREVRAEFEARQ